MKNQFLFFISISISINVFFSCNDTTNKKNENRIEVDTVIQSINSAPDVNTDSLKSEVMMGNYDSYLKLKNIYLDYPSEDFLFWAIVMADKFDSDIACLDVFYTMLSGYQVDTDFIGYAEIDEDSRILMNSYLEKAIDLGNEDAVLIKEQIAAVEKH
jgi:hypothetical protein